MSVSVRPTLFKDEGAFPFMLRLADMTGNASGRVFCFSHGLDFHAVQSGQQNGELARLVGLPADAFDGATFTKKPGGETRIGTETLSKFDWLVNTLKVCPHCVREDAAIEGRPGESSIHIRSWWWLKNVTVCPVHHVRLISEPKPGWGKFEQFPLNILRDGIRERVLSVDDLQIIPVERADAEAYILGRLDLMPRTDCPFLDQMPLTPAMRLMDRVGAIAEMGKRAHANGRVVDQNVTLNRAFELFSGDGRGFVELLDRLVLESAGKRGATGPGDVYGRAYRWLNSVRDDPAYAPVIAIMKRHAIANVPLSPDVRFFGEYLQERQFFKLHHIWRESRIHWTKARYILQSTGEISPDDEDPSFDRETALRIIAFLKDTMNHNSAGKYIGMTRGTIRVLLDSGVIVPRVRAKTFGSNEHVFLKSELDAIVSTAKGEATEVFEAETNVLKDIINAGKYACTSCAEVLRMLLDGSVSCVGVLKGKRGLGALLVDYRDVKTAIPKKPEDLLTVVELGKYLSVSFFAAQQFVERGYIQSCDYVEKVRKASRATFVRIDDTKRFMDEFASSQELAVRFGTHVRILVPELTRRGIMPAISRDLVGQHFYRREDVEGIDFPVPKRLRRRRGRMHLVRS